MKRFLSLLIPFVFWASVAKADVELLVTHLLANTTQFQAVSGTQVIIGTQSVDGADSNQLCLSAAPGCTTNGTRTGYITVAGNETDTGSIRLQAGLIASSQISLYAPNSTSSVTLGVNNPNDWQFTRNGTANTVLRNATGAGDIELSLSGTTIALQEGTAASACQGSSTFTGTTPVVISTTCARSTMQVVLAPTSDPTGSTAAYCWWGNVVNNTSFEVDCDQANDGNFKWSILHESP